LANLKNNFLKNFYIGDTAIKGGLRGILTRKSKIRRSAMSSFIQELTKEKEEEIRNIEAKYTSKIFERAVKLIGKKVQIIDKIIEIKKTVKVVDIEVPTSVYVFTIVTEDEKIGISEKMEVNKIR